MTHLRRPLHSVITRAVGSGGVVLVAVACGASSSPSSSPLPSVSAAQLQVGMSALEAALGEAVDFSTTPQAKDAETVWKLADACAVTAGVPSTVSTNPDFYRVFLGSCKLGGAKVTCESGAQTHSCLGSVRTTASLSWAAPVLTLAYAATSSSPVGGWTNGTLTIEGARLKGTWKSSDTPDGSSCGRDVTPQVISATVDVAYQTTPSFCITSGTVLLVAEGPISGSGTVVWTACGASHLEP